MIRALSLKCSTVCMMLVRSWCIRVCANVRKGACISVWVGEWGLQYKLLRVLIKSRKCYISSGPFTWLIYSKSSKEIWGSALQIWYQWELLHRSSKQKSKQKPCSLPKCLLHAFCWWQTSTCKTAEANGISPCGPTYCTHSSCMKVFFFFWWNALTFLLN